MTNKSLPPPKSRVLPVYKLAEYLRQNYVNIEAPYQRDVVWDDSKMSVLIDSIFNNYYIPPLVFAIRKVKNRNTRIVIDGKQRLTSIDRFMKNEIPYIDHFSGVAVPTYFSQDPEEVDVDNKHYLDEDDREKFENFEFVCMEYSDITEDDEFDIFSRVQLGVAITSAEKLKAHNTPVAKLSREIAQDNANLDVILPKKGQANIFQTVAHIMLTLKNDKEDFKGQTPQLSQFVSSNYVPIARMKDTLRRVIQVISALASDPLYNRIFSTSRGERLPLRIVELLVFAKFIALVQRPRTLRSYAEDFRGLREWLYDRKGGRLYMGRDTFMCGMEFAERSLEQNSLMAAPRPEVFGVYDSEDEEEDSTDELKMDEYEPETSPIQVSSASASPTTIYTTPNKRRRTEVATKTTPGTTATATAPRTTLAGKPTAKRGGKVPSMTRR